MPVLKSKHQFYWHQYRYFIKFVVKINYLTIYLSKFYIIFTSVNFKNNAPMKNVSKVILVSFMFLATFLISCDKEVQTSPITVDKTQKATIHGFVYAELDLTHFGVEFAPAGTKVIITFPYTNLGLSASAGSYIDTLTLDAKGSFTAVFPSDADGVNVTIKLVDFIYDQVQPFSTKERTVKKYYTCNATTINGIKADDSQVVEINYNAPNTFDDVTSWVTISGKITAETDNTVVGEEPLNSGTQLIFYATGWSTTVTIAANGAYSVDVPNNVAVSISYNFLHPGKIAGPTNVNWRFKGTKAVGTFTADTNNVNISLGVGVTE
jgi:hypothetical protein